MAMGVMEGRSLQPDPCPGLRQVYRRLLSCHRFQRFAGNERGFTIWWIALVEATYTGKCNCSSFDPDRSVIAPVAQVSDDVI
jgi:hypothetical protein